MIIHIPTSSISVFQKAVIDQNQFHDNEPLYKDANGKFRVPGTSPCWKNIKAQNNLEAARTTTLVGKLLFFGTPLRNKWQEQADIAENTFKLAADKGKEYQDSFYEDDLGSGSPQGKFTLIFPPTKLSINASNDSGENDPRAGFSLE